MNAEEITRFYRESREKGFVGTGIWGGEPLLRPDLERIVEGAQKAGLLTILLTNGYYLEEQLPQLSPWLNSVVLSLDYPDKKHDRLRGCPGLFQRVMRAVEILRSRHPHIRVLINCLLHRGNEKQIPQLAALAREMGVSFYVCPVKTDTLPGGKTRSVKGWEADKEEEKDTARLLLRLKKEGYPLNNSYTYLQEFLEQKRPFPCRLPMIALVVRPDGEIVNCLEPAVPLGNARANRLHDILSSSTYKEMRLAAEKCNHCNNPNVVESSYLWEMKVEPLLNAFRVLVRGR